MRKFFFGNGLPREADESVIIGAGGMGMLSYAIGHTLYLWVPHYHSDTTVACAGVGLFFGLLFGRGKGSRPLLTILIGVVAVCMYLLGESLNHTDGSLVQGCVLIVLYVCALRLYAEWLAQELTQHRST